MLITFAFLFGLFLGSFLNVVIYRLWTHEQFLTGRSHCPHCHHALEARDLIPLVSFVALRGRCRYCRKPISWQYPLVELVTGCALAFAAMVFGWSLAFFLVALVTLLLIVIFVFDVQHRLILDVVSVPFAVFAFLTGLAVGRSWLVLLIGAAAGGGFFLLQILISRGRWVGGGDAKFGVGMGLLLGWEQVLLALFLAYIVGALFASVLLLLRKANAHSAIPFGAFLAPATYVAMLWGAPLLHFYDTLS